MKWREAFGLTHDREADGDRLVREIVRLMSSVLRCYRPEEVVRIGLAANGPVRYDVGGILRLGWPRRATATPFYNYPIMEGMGRMLRELCGEEYSDVAWSERVVVLHDAAAAVLGETGPGGVFAGCQDAAVVVIGTGIGLGVIENGRLYPGDDSLAEERMLASLGRRLVYVPDHTVEHGYRYEYRSIEWGETRVAIDGTRGETHFAERVAGPWLAERLVRELAHLDKTEHSLVTRAMGLSRVPPEHLEQLVLRRTFHEWRELEVRVLEGLTAAALANNPWAIERIRAVGTEIGRALLKFVEQFEDRPFTQRVALASTVAERLGLGVNDGLTGADLLMQCVNEAIRHRRGIDCQVVRSSNYDRELLAFAPAQS